MPIRQRTSDIRRLTNQLEMAVHRGANSLVSRGARLAIAGTQNGGTVLQQGSSSKGASIRSSAQKPNANPDVVKRPLVRGPDKKLAEAVLWMRALFSPIIRTDDVSRLLGMSVDAVLRIPRSELPYAHSGLGYGHRYVREDVASYGRRLVARQSENMNSRHSPDPLDEIVDSVRGRSS